MELKKYYRNAILRSANICAIICLVIVVGAGVIGAKSILSVIQGPKKIKPGEDLSKYENEYVTMDIQYVMDEFIRVKSQKKSKTGSVVSTKLTKIGYLIYNYDDLGEDIRENYFAIMLPSSYEKEMEQRINHFWDYLSREREDAPEKFTVTGTVRPLKGDYKKYFDKEINEIDGLIEGGWGFQNISYYEIDYYYVGSFSKVVTYSFIVSMILAAIIGVFNYMNATLCFDANYKKFLKKHPNVNEDDLDLIFSRAQDMGKDIFYAGDYLFYKVGNKFGILYLKDYIWGYYYKRTGRNAVSEMRFFDMQRKMIRISAIEPISNDILRKVYENCPHLVVGYSKDLEQCFKKNFDDFLNIRYNKASQTQNQQMFEE